MNAIGPLPLQTAPEEYGECQAYTPQYDWKGHVLFDLFDSQFAIQLKTIRLVPEALREKATGLVSCRPPGDAAQLFVMNTESSLFCNKAM